MVLQTKAGSFVLNTGTGDQTISGVGFQPDGILFFATGSLTEGTSAVDSRFSYGMTDGTNDRTATAQAEDGVATHTERFQNITNVIILLNAATAVSDILVSHVSMNSDGFVLNVGANINSEAILVKYFAIGGVTNIIVDSINVDLSPVTGLGFQPNLLMVMCAGQAGGTIGSMHALSSCFGVAERFSGTTRQWRNVMFMGEDDRAAISSTVVSDGFTGQVYNGTLNWSLSLTTFDTGGFTWAGTDGVDNMSYMAIELPTGIEAFAGVQTKVTGGAPATQTLPNSTFTPQSYIICNGHDTVDGTPTQQSALMSIGAYSQPGTPSQFNISVATEIAAGSQADCRADATNVVIETALGGGTVAEAIAQTITDSTPDIIWDPNTGTADFLGYLAFEEDPAGAALVEFGNENLNITEPTPLKFIEIMQFANETLNISEILEDPPPRSVTRLIPENENIAEDLVKARDQVRFQDEDLNITEDITKLTPFIKFANETVNIAEGVLQFVGLGITKVIDETLNILEDLVKARGQVRVVDEVEDISEALLSLVMQVRVVDETEDIPEEVLEILGGGVIKVVGGKQVIIFP